jgi:peptide/nickel transport system substrate-binding protein
MSISALPPSSFRRPSRRGLSTISSALVIVIVLALVGTIAYGVMGGFSAPLQPSCQPANSIACGQLANLHDVALLVPFQASQQGNSIPFTATLPSGETATSYAYDFGDGTPIASTSSPTISHTYTTPGVYLVSVQATVNSVAHDNYQALVQIHVNPSFAGTNPETLPTVSGSILGNTSASPQGPSPTAVLQAGESVELGASYANSPSNPLWRDVPPSIAVPTDATITKHNTTPVSATYTLQFTKPGSYIVSFVGGSTNLTNGTAPVAFENFSWSIFVADTGVHAGVIGLRTPTSPHPGRIIDYELAPGGARTEDPAIAYDTVSYEPILNVYQPLITYNGSSVGPGWQSFVPGLATCVPGSPQCQALYGSSLISSDNLNFTFVVNGASQFYDPKTGGHWGVYPSDVVFSVARTLGFSTLPCVSCNNGWILAQALLDSGNATWDTIHQAFNNTPQQILDSMTVNDSLCQSLAGAMTTDHGCVTFHASGGHRNWPYFLELIADPLGGSIVPCGWFSARDQGAGIPYWTIGNSSGAGDHPCEMPGAGGYGIPVAQMPFQGWDQWETIGSGSTGRFLGNVQYGMAGSGPYYLSNYQISTSYTLTASPQYVQNPYCTWSACYPSANPGHYANQVEVTWEVEPTQGEQALAAGIADFAAVPTTDISLLLQLISQQKVNAITNPTLTIGFDPFNFNFNVGGAQHYVTSPITIKGDFFSYLGMRQFFVHSYPYATIQQTINTKSGIVLAFNYGGAIPQYMGDYYPSSIAWPSGDPCSDSSNPACAGYWWNQMHDPASPYYDPEVLSCTSANPCQFPFFGTTGNPTGDQIQSIWSGWITKLTGGAIQMSTQDINFVNVIINSQDSAATQNPMPIYGLGWAPDYPDPTDYTVPLYLENSTYTYGDAIAQSLYKPAWGAASCQPASNYDYYANLSLPVEQDCQATAYKAMIKLLGIAAITPAGPSRVQLYAQAEAIANQLALYVYTAQGNGLGTAAAWVNINSLNTNPTIGAGGDTPFFWLTGGGVAG